jgi:hypothetical protein
MKETKQIVGSVRSGGKVYKTGDEDALAEVLTSEEAARLTESGQLVGFSKAEAEDEAKSSSKKGARK